MRFEGTVEWLGYADVDGLARWAAGIPWDNWPQQHPMNGQLRPAMITEHWPGFKVATDGLVAHLQKVVPQGLTPGQRLLSVVMPGHNIQPHVDKQLETWWGRVHVPVTSDPLSVFNVGNEAFHLLVGNVYVVNTKKVHSVSNVGGSTPRLHFMVDFERL